MRARLAVSVLSGLLLGPSLAEAASKPELLVVALRTEDRPTADGIEAWKAVQREVKRARRRLKVSLKLQKELHDFLIGPAREQVNDCGDDAVCLREVGSTLGTSILIVGTVAKRSVRLTAIDAATGRELAKASSKSRRGRVRTLAKKAARRLLKRLRKNMKLLGKPVDPPAAVAVADPPSTPSLPPVGGPAATPGTEPGTESGPEAGTDPTSAPPPGPGAASATEAVAQGSLSIASSQLAGVREVRVDGSAVPFAGDGSLRWTGNAGVVRIVAIKSDGSQLQRSVTVAEAAVTPVTLDFPAATAATTAAATPEEKESVTGKWWFWTAIGAAVAAGATTAAVVAAGGKGGPVVPDETGSVRGTY